MCVAGEGTSPIKILRMVRILRLFKLVRLLKASRVLARMERRNTLPYAYISFMAVISQVLIITHWSSCLLGILGQAAAPSQLDTWQAKFGLCTPGDPLIDPCSGERTVVCVDEGLMYVKTFYWALGLITGITNYPSYGPFPPHFSQITALNETSHSIFTTTEDVSLIIIALVSSAVWAYVTGKIVDLIANANPDRTAFMQKMDDLNRFTNFYNLPTKTVARVEGLLLREARSDEDARTPSSVCRHESYAADEDGMGDQQEMAGLRSFFSDAEMPFLTSVALRMQQAVYAPGDRPTRPLFM